MIVVHGIERFGKVDEVDGEYLVTRFHHLFFLPLVPIGSEWVTKRDVAGIHGRACRLSWRSVAIAYARSWGLASALLFFVLGVSGSTAWFLPAIMSAYVAVATWSSRRQSDPLELRRVALQRSVFGMALDPARLPRDSADILLPIAEQRFDDVSGGYTAAEVALRGAASPIQAGCAFVLLRLRSVTHRESNASNARAVSDALLRAHDLPPAANDDDDDNDGPYRTAPTRAVAAPPLLAAYLLSPHRIYGVTATLASWAAYLAFVWSGPLTTCLCAGKADLARAGVKKLHYESYPQWEVRTGGGCPTGKELAEYGGSVKDPWGSDYVILCNGIAVVSKGPDQRIDTDDDITSWGLE